MESIYLILGCIGFPSIKKVSSLETPQKPEEIIYYLQINDARATMRIDASGYTILKNSTICEDSSKGRTDNTLKGTYRRRDEAISQGIAVKQGNNYILTEDMVFSSPSGAAQFVYGNSLNGRKNWKTKDNKSLSEIEKMQIDASNKLE